MSFSKLKKTKISSQTLAIWLFMYCVHVMDLGIAYVFPKIAFGQSFPQLYSCLRTFSLIHSLWQIFFSIPLFILFTIFIIIKLLDIMTPIEICYIIELWNKIYNSCIIRKIHSILCWTCRKYTLIPPPLLVAHLALSQGIPKKSLIQEVLSSRFFFPVWVRGKLRIFYVTFNWRNDITTKNGFFVILLHFSLINTLNIFFSIFYKFG